jgi:outer membrane protein assembly factor BamA
VTSARRLPLLPAALAAAVAAAAAASAPAPARADAPAPDTVSPTRFDPAVCEPRKDDADGAAPAAPAAPGLATPGSPGSPGAIAPAPVTWSGFELSGTLIDPEATVRALMMPVMTRNRALTDAAREEIAGTAGEFGYHVVGLGTREAPGGTRAVLHLAPKPIVRQIKVDVSQSVFAELLDDEIRRRMTKRVGAYLPWDPIARACELWREAVNIEGFLRDEGYFEARASIDQRITGASVILDVKVAPGPGYTVDVDRIGIFEVSALQVSQSEIRDQFRHRGRCLVGPYLCFGKPRFTLAQHQADLQKVVQLFQARNYPAVRVRTDFDPATSFDRRTRTVRFNLTIDPRRGLDVQFVGQTPGTVSVEQLKQQLTFNSAGSTDDLEAAQSARAIAEYLQSRGYFDARVTWSHERFSVIDHLLYRIDQGASRTVRTVAFTGNRTISADVLADAIATQPRRLSTSLFGASAAATSKMLEDDAGRIADLYRARGYRDVAVRVSAAPDPAAVGSAALTAALVSAGRGQGLHVRFSIDEGLPTLLGEVRVDLGDKADAVTTPEDRALCRQALADLAELHGYPGFATPTREDRCAALASGLLFREGDVIGTRDALRDRLYAHGRPRADVEYQTVPIATRVVAARYRLRNTQELSIGKIVIRGNFRTRDWIIRDALAFREGAALTRDVLGDAVRRLRNTTLFDAVNIKMLDLDQTSTGAVNAVVEVTERYGFAQVELEAGYSSFNGAFVKLIPSFKNLFGLGISLDLTGTLGFDLGAFVADNTLRLRQLAAEATLRIPPWLPGSLGFQRELTAFHRRQETPRFGLLRTTGLTASLSRTWERQRLGSRPARAITTGFHYDYRRRERNVDALRPIGANDDESQVPITTITGSIGATFEWEQRVDRRGTLSPLAPEDGFRFDGQVSVASPYLSLGGGQDTFIKVSAAGSRYWSLGPHLVLRADLRYDQGFPLDDAALLPEVERFFAGGDATVRGYEDERLATELIEVGVPPLGNVKQIRILPAGGNIRALGSLDAQLRIYKFLATALFLDAGLIANQWNTVTVEDIRPAAGIALIRLVTPFGVAALERAIPLQIGEPRLGDDPRGRWHLSFAARAQF